MDLQPSTLLELRRSFAGRKLPNEMSDNTVGEECSKPFAIFPVAYSQERRLVFEEARRYRGARYPPAHVHVAFVFEGALDIGALQAALTELIIRHSIFRTAFLPAIN